MRLKQREIWKIHPIYTNYEVSDFGRVKRGLPGLGARAGRILEPVLDNNGYFRVCLCQNRKQKGKAVHHLVLETFISSRPEKKECNHKDGNRRNNFVSNLEWVTSKENQIHAYKNKLKFPKKGERNGNSKLKEGEVWLIKKLLANKVLGSKIAKMFKVNKCTISSIKHGRLWKHIYF